MGDILLRQLQSRHLGPVVVVGVAADCHHLDIVVGTGSHLADTAAAAAAAAAAADLHNADHLDSPAGRPDIHAAVDGADLLRDAAFVKGRPVPPSG